MPIKLTAVLIILFASPGVCQQKQPGQTVDSETHFWTGSLIDARRTACGPEVKRASTAGTCPVSMTTTTFALLLPNGNSLSFDEGGNAKAIDALRRSRKASKILFNYWKTGKSTGIVTAQVTGTQTSDILNVESIKIN